VVNTIHWAPKSVGPAPSHGDAVESIAPLSDEATAFSQQLSSALASRASLVAGAGSSSGPAAGGAAGRGFPGLSDSASDAGRAQREAREEARRERAVELERRQERAEEAREERRRADEHAERRRRAELREEERVEYRREQRERLEEIARERRERLEQDGPDTTDPGERPDLPDLVKDAGTLLRETGESNGTELREEALSAETPNEQSPVADHHGVEIDFGAAVDAHWAQAAEADLSAVELRRSSTTADGAHSGRVPAAGHASEQSGVERTAGVHRTSAPQEIVHELNEREAQGAASGVSSSDVTGAAAYARASGRVPPSPSTASAQASSLAQGATGGAEPTASEPTQRDNRPDALAGPETAIGSQVGTVSGGGTVMESPAVGAPGHALQSSASIAWPAGEAATIDGRGELQDGVWPNGGGSGLVTDSPGAWDGSRTGAQSSATPAGNESTLAELTGAGVTAGAFTGEDTSGAGEPLGNAASPPSSSADGLSGNARSRGAPPHDAQTGNAVPGNASTANASTGGAPADNARPMGAVPTNASTGDSVPGDASSGNTPAGSASAVRPDGFRGQAADRSGMHVSDGSPNEDLLSRSAAGSVEVSSYHPVDSQSAHYSRPPVGEDPLEVKEAERAERTEGAQVDLSREGVFRQSGRPDVTGSGAGMAGEYGARETGTVAESGGNAPYPPVGGAVPTGTAGYSVDGGFPAIPEAGANSGAGSSAEAGANGEAGANSRAHGNGGSGSNTGAGANDQEAYADSLSDVSEKLGSHRVRRSAEGSSGVAFARYGGESTEGELDPAHSHPSASELSAEERATANRTPAEWSDTERSEAGRLRAERADGGRVSMGGAEQAEGTTERRNIQVIDLRGRSGSGSERGNGSNMETRVQSDSSASRMHSGGDRVADGTRSAEKGNDRLSASDRSDGDNSRTRSDDEPGFDPAAGRTASASQGSERAAAQSAEQSSRLAETLDLAKRLREQANSEIVRSARMVLRDSSRGEIDLYLEPERLGKVRIQLELRDDHVGGRIFVENQTVRDAFAEVLPDLERAFADIGLSAEGIDVAVTDEDQQGEATPGQFERQDARAREVAELAQSVPEAEIRYDDLRLIDLVV